MVPLDSPPCPGQPEDSVTTRRDRRYRRRTGLPESSGLHPDQTDGDGWTDGRMDRQVKTHFKNRSVSFTAKEPLHRVEFGPQRKGRDVRAPPSPSGPRPPACPSARSVSRETHSQARKRTAERRVSSWTLVSCLTGLEGLCCETGASFISSSSSFCTISRSSSSSSAKRRSQQVSPPR